MNDICMTIFGCVGENMDERIIMKAEDFSISSLCREPNITLDKPMIKALKKWLWMQKKNRRRWGV